MRKKYVFAQGKEGNLGALLYQVHAVRVYPSFPLVQNKTGVFASPAGYEASLR